MDDLLSDFLTETTESLDVIDAELVKFEQEPGNTRILDNIFRLVHTIKGTCGFLGLPRLAALAHAAETLMGAYRSGAPVTREGVSLILQTIDRIKQIVGELEQTGAEPAGSDDDLISRLERLSAAGAAEASGAAQEYPASDDIEVSAGGSAPMETAPEAASLEELERAFRETPGLEELTKDIPPGPAAVNGEGEAGKEGGGTGESAPADPSKTGDHTPRSQSIRVNVDTLEQLMTMVSELVLTRNQLLEMVRRLENSEFKTPLQRLSAVTGELQDAVMKTRMQPIGNAWQKLPRIVRDLSSDLGKKINLEMHGADTELDRQVLELIRDPLTHMVRNSADHGLESTEERLRAGKPETGTISLNAYHEGGHIIIEVADDGGGVNTENVKNKAIASGLVTQADLEKMPAEEIHQLIFQPGFSTAKTVTSISGRGVGMDVVRANIELIGGTVDLKSTSPQGSTFIIKIPLTLAIISALIVESHGQRFALPQLSVLELVRIQHDGEHRIEMINDAPVLRLRDRLLPLIRLSRLLELEKDGEETRECEEEQNLFVVVLQVGAQLFGIVVDNVFDTEEIVVKPMSSMLRDIPLFSGNTILGDGSVIMILDPNGVAQSVAHTGITHTERAASSGKTSSRQADEDQRTPLLLFRAGSQEPKAVPLSLITRLEEIDAADIERANGREMIQYRGTLMPLLHAGGEEVRKREGEQPILVFSDRGRALGLAVDEILDIVEDRLNIEVRADAPGMIGSAIVNGRATEIVDVAYYLQQVFDDWMQERDGASGQGGMRVLLIDDSAFFRNMLAPVLSAAGYDVTLADSAYRAFELRDQGERFDIIVSDIEMPGMDGIAMAETLRGDPCWKDTPIIALSSHSAPHIIERSRKAGFADFVGKFDRTGLMERLKACSAQLGEAA